MAQKKVVIIGGGFAGSTIAKKLESDFMVTLIDRKDYFEFTPGILRAIVKPKHLKSLQVKHNRYLKNTSFIKSAVKKITSTHVMIDKTKIPFDYLVIASGSSYHTPIKVHNLVNSSNAKLLDKNYHKLCKAKSVLIVGGGVVGVELAAEIATAYRDDIRSHDKKVTVMESNDFLMPREEKKVSLYAEYFLKDHGVNIIFGKRCSKEDMIPYDLVLFATGIAPNTSFIPKKFLDDRKFIKVKKTLQLENHKHIFAAGDATSIKEEKLAQTAEVHAAIVARNIRALEEKELLEHHEPKSRLKIISLGPWNGIISYKGRTFTGFIPGVLKNIFEFFFMTTRRYF